MLVRVNDANEDVQEKERTTPDLPGRATSAAIDTSIEEDDGYPFIKKKEEKPDRNSERQNNGQLAIRIECNGLTAEFFGNTYYTCRNFTAFMDKMGGKHVSNR